MRSEIPYWHYRYFSTQAMSAGIPVFDAVQNTESINQWMQKLQQWEKPLPIIKVNLMRISSN
jgi:type IV secretion system protein VirB5